MKFEQQPSQQQKQMQKLAMTQQLQQSIQILQYSNEELYAFLMAKSLENPLIDIEIENDGTDFAESSSRSTNFLGDQADYLNQIPDEHRSLFDCLIDQIHLNYRDTYLRSLMLFLVEYIDSNGYLTISLEAACLKTGASSIEVLDAVTLIQQLDPAGVGARNLEECLLLQIERDSHAPNLAYIIVEEAFLQLANRKWSIIAKMFDISLKEIQCVFDYIQTLSPSPGNIFGSITESVIYPDLRVLKQNEDLRLISNQSKKTTIRFQKAYFERMNATHDKEVQVYLIEKRKEFEWLQKAIAQRGETIFNVGVEILRRQRDFFISPEHPLIPMTLKDIAQTLSIHESTVSRSVNGKYIETEFGMFELRSFFSKGVAQVSENQMTSTTTIKKRIQEFINSENKQKPLSDQKIVTLLADRHITLSRRTVTKYREELGIPSSPKRKRYETD